MCTGKVMREVVASCVEGWVRKNVRNGTWQISVGFFISLFLYYFRVEKILW